MPQVTVTIAGRAYRMACAEGEQPHLEALAGFYNGKIEDIRGAFGEIGDMRLQVMASLTIADELFEMRRRAAALEDEAADLKALAEAGAERAESMEARVAETLLKTAERLERLARALSPPQIPDPQAAGPGQPQEPPPA